MPNYPAEALVPLSSLSKKFNYTQDHLAYLCRKGFIYAERKGRKWFTAEEALLTYQKTMQIAGKPVMASDQVKVLSRPSQQAEAINKPPVFTLSNPFLGLQAKYRNLALHYFQPKVLVPAVAYSGLNLGIAPSNLPLAELPQELSIRPFYREPAISLPLGFIVLLGLFSFNPGMATKTVLAVDSIFLQTETRAIAHFETATEQSVLVSRTTNSEGTKQKVAGTAISSFIPLQNSLITAQIGESNNEWDNLKNFTLKSGSYLNYLKSEGKQLLNVMFTKLGLIGVRVFAFD